VLEDLDREATLVPRLIAELQGRRIDQVDAYRTTGRGLGTGPEDARDQEPEETDSRTSSALPARLCAVETHTCMVRKK
jgi:hypothetical protein